MIYSNDKGVYHYRSMAKTNFQSHLRADTVPLKKYLYVLRALLSVRWIERYQGAPPIEFDKLLHLIDDTILLQDIDALLLQKRAASELGKSAPITSISTFIEVEMTRLDTTVFAPVYRERDIDRLNQLFRAELQA